MVLFNMTLVTEICVIFIKCFLCNTFSSKYHVFIGFIWTYLYFRGKQVYSIKWLGKLTNPNLGCYVEIAYFCCWYSTQFSLLFLIWHIEYLNEERHCVFFRWLLNFTRVKWVGWKISGSTWIIGKKYWKSKVSGDFESDLSGWER